MEASGREVLRGDAQPKTTLSAQSGRSVRRTTVIQAAIQTQRTRAVPPSRSRHYEVQATFRCHGSLSVPSVTLMMFVYPKSFKIAAKVSKE